MPMNAEVLKNRDAKGDLGAKLLESVTQMKSDRTSRIHRVKVPLIVSARIKSRLTQADFAKLLGVSIKTLQDWEQGRRQLSGAAKTLIAIAEHRPDVLKEISA